MTDRNAFLTEQRQRVVDGETSEEMGIADATHRQYQRDTTELAQSALQELIEVANSPAIDNTEVFDPDKMFHLLRAILSPDSFEQYDDDLDLVGLVGRDDFTDEYRAYTDRMHVQINKLLRDYENRTVGTDNDE